MHSSSCHSSCTVLKGTLTCSNHSDTVSYETYVAGRRNLNMYIPFCLSTENAHKIMKWSKFLHRYGFWLQWSNYIVFLPNNMIFDTRPLCKETYAGFRLTCRIAATPLDHHLLFQSCSSHRQRRFGFSPSGNRSELNRIQLSAICRGGQSGKVIDLLAWRCLPLGHPSAASGACAVELITSSKRQCGKRQVSLKPALCYTLLYHIHSISRSCPYNCPPELFSIWNIWYY